MRLPAVLLGLALVLGGCGYHPMNQPGLFPAGVRSLHIALFDNRTAEAFLESTLTEAVIERFSRDRNLTLAERPEGADAILSGTVLGYSLAAGAYNRLDQISEYRLTLVLQAEVRSRADGRVLWQGSLQRSEEFPSALDKSVQEDNETAAAQVLAARLAEDLHYHALADF